MGFELEADAVRPMIPLAIVLSGFYSEGRIIAPLRMTDLSVLTAASDEALLLSADFSASGV